ncbi:Thiol-disulfide oxidoreductase ResA [bioreactor metagenome]|uniref:Thiol-disulfide oxidoreductase ResA n=1 Tax=bioreactor metagenome TaxID=1076179 RepID=A0A645A8P7_9ZZZZ
MIRAGLTVMFLFIFLSGFSQNGFVLKGQISNFQRPATIYLLSVEGSEWEVADSMKSKSGEVLFTADTIPVTGEYYIFWEEKYFINLVINKENRIEFTADNLEKDLDVKILVSAENIAFYQLRAIESSIDSLSAIGDEFYEKGLNAQLQKIKSQLSTKVDELENRIQTLDKEQPGLFSVKLYRSSIPPDFETYSKANPDQGYESEYDFLKRHYFDNIDKHDSCLVNTRAIYDACSFYLRNFTDEKTTQGYIRSADFIMSSFSWNNKQYDYVLNLLLNTFESAGFDEVYLHLFDTYMHSSSCEGGIPSEAERKALSIRNLKKGTPAPELTGTDREGKTVSLSDFKGKTVVVMFWESSCMHCREAIPHVLELMKSNPDIVLLSWSVDTLENNWVGGILEENLPEPSISDLKGYDGPFAIDWCVWGTPGFFVIDPEGKIVAKPLTLKALQDALK